MPRALAASFADRLSVIRYEDAIRQGKTEDEALKVGDKGTGVSGQDTTSSDTPMCALPQTAWTRMWGNRFLAMGRQVAVTYKGKTVIGQLIDTMPSHPKSGAQIYLNPGFAKAFGLSGPFTIWVSWEWSGSGGLKQLPSIL